MRTRKPIPQMTDYQRDQPQDVDGEAQAAEDQASTRTSRVIPMRFCSLCGAVRLAVAGTV
jgi:membrane protease subunit (stomatin/prohibitin family)